MMTQNEVKRMTNKFDGLTLLDTNLRPEVLNGQLEEFVEKIRVQLKRTTKGRKLVICYGDFR